jgi:hypothetical protein
MAQGDFMEPWNTWVSSRLEEIEKRQQEILEEKERVTNTALENNKADFQKADSRAVSCLLFCCYPMYPQREKDKTVGVANTNSKPPTKFEDTHEALEWALEPDKTGTFKHMQDEDKLCKIQEKNPMLNGFNYDSVYENDAAVFGGGYDATATKKAEEDLADEWLEMVTLKVLDGTDNNTSSSTTGNDVSDPVASREFTENKLHDDFLATIEADVLSMRSPQDRRTSCSYRYREDLCVCV